MPSRWSGPAYSPATTKQPARRFRNEAEAVALLDHPGIVPVYEVGAHDSQHYFSMKLVPGGSLVPLLTRYRDDPRAAARLAALAAEAVAHAHARGILHRDLKPANILIDDQGRPHLTDFGLAKKVEADVELTQSGAILGTPAYMSPEQASGRRGAVTTASDVYGLGAVLYSLLTGRAPFGGDSVVETIDAVRHRPPEPPRQLNAALPRDLETICLRCLEKDPRRRYPTAQALAEDLRAWLDSRPIAARRVGPAERAWLWCRRRPAVAALSAAVALAVVGGAAATIAVQYAANRRLDAKNFELDRANAGLRIAIGQKDQANAALAQANIRVQARFDLAREAIRSLKQGVEEEETLKEGRLRPLRDKLLGSARRFYDRLGELLRGQPDAGSKAVLAESYAELGELIDRIGQKPEAREAYRKAVAIRRELETEGTGPSARVELARALNALGWEASQLDDHAGAIAAFEEARSLAEPLATGAGATIEARRALGLAYFRAGQALAATGAEGRALAAYRRAREVREPLAREAAAAPDDRFAFADTIVGIGDLLESTGDLAGALTEQRKAQELLRDLAAEHPAVPEYRRDLAASHNRVGIVLYLTGDLAGALAEDCKDLELMRALAAEHPAVPEYRFDLAVCHKQVGSLLHLTGNLAGALAEYRKGQELVRALAAEYPAVPEYRLDLAVSHLLIGGPLTTAGRPAEGLPELESARSLLEDLARSGPNVPEYRDRLAATLNAAGNALRDLGRPGDARDRHARALALAEGLTSAYPSVPVYRGRLADSLRRLAQLKLDAGDAVGASADASRSVRLFEGLPASGTWHWFNLACARATLAAVAARDGSVPSAAELPGLTDRAIDALRRAAATGYRDLAAYRYEPALAHLRDRDDFRVLLLDLAFPADPFVHRE